MGAQTSASISVSLVRHGDEEQAGKDNECISVQSEGRKGQWSDGAPCCFGEVETAWCHCGKEENVQWLRLQLLPAHRDERTHSNWTWFRLNACFCPPEFITAAYLFIRIPDILPSLLSPQMVVATAVTMLTIADIYRVFTRPHLSGIMSLIPHNNPYDTGTIL